MKTDDALLHEFIATSPDHALVKRANREYSKIIARVRGGRGAMLRTLRAEPEPVIVFVDEHGENKAIVGLASFKDLEKRNRRSTNTAEGALAPSTYLLDFVRERARKPKEHPQLFERKDAGSGRVRTLESKGGPVMTTLDRVTDFIFNRAFDPISYTADGRRIGVDYSRSLGNKVSVAGQRSVQLSMFPNSMASMKAGDFEFEVQRTPISDGLLFFGDRRPPSDNESAAAADAVFADGGHLYKLVALAHSLDGWMPWNDAVADRFHWHRSDKDHRARRSAFRYFEMARAFMIRHKKISKYPIVLIDSKPGRAPGESWSIRKPLIFDDAHRRINLQSRPTGALYRMPRRQNDPIPLMYSVAEAILQSGAGVDKDNRMPILVDSPLGTDWQDTLLLWALCGRPIPIDPKGRENARRYINRRIKMIVDLQASEPKPETVVFDYEEGGGKEKPAKFKITATDEFREAHLNTRSFEFHSPDEIVGRAS